MVDDNGEPRLPEEQRLLQTPLHGLHLELGARMVPFAGYSLPVQYPGGLIAEHRHTRESAGLFDVSHMGQLALAGEEAPAALETLVPADVIGLAAGRQRYGLLLTDEGTIMDDLMLANRGRDILMVVNGACKAGDIGHIRERIGARCEVVALPDRALLALQGPKAVDALASLLPAVSQLVFMTGAFFSWGGGELFITRSGYTGEDGFEISVHESLAPALARALLGRPEVKPAGLGARNSLRLEAGLCLYGSDMDASTTPAEAALGWAIPRVRRGGGARAGGFPGAPKVLAQLEGAAPLARQRVGLVALEGVPVREHSALQDAQGTAIGEVTSGLPGPTVGKPVAMGYVPPALAVPGTRVAAIVRGRPVPMEVTRMPFVPARYHRGTGARTD
jgi:aminomethyltransferase